MNRKRLSLFSALSIALLMAFSALMLPINTRAADDSCKADSAAWIGSFGFGANCLDDAGWKTYEEGKSQLQSAQVNDIAICADGTTWIANTLGLLKITDGKEQAIQGDTPSASIEGIACDGKGGLWAAHFQGISHFSDGKWETTDAKKLGTGDTVSLVKDVVVAPDGKVYTVTSNSVAVFDGKDWTYFEKGKGFDEQYFFDGLTVDSKGTIYAIAGSDLLIFDGKEWKVQKNDAMYTTTSIAVDSKGTVWVGTFSQGLMAFDGSGWTTYDVQKSKLSSNHVTALAVDGQDRVWIGTDYGLDVLSGKDVTVYQMATSGLVDNDIKTVAVAGKGPALPKTTEPKTGSLSGTIMNGKEPLADATVELCTASVPTTFSGDTPCGDQPDSINVKTDKDGKFSFDKLPIGHYGLVLQQANGKWAVLTDSYGLNSKSDVKEGETTDIGTIDVSKKSK